MKQISDNSQVVFFLPFGLTWVALALICTLFKHNSLLLVGMILVCAASLYFRFRAFKAFVGVFALFLGLFGEYACTRLGMWIYANPSIGGLPIWLGLVWPVLMVNFLEMAHYLNSFFSTPRIRLPGLIHFALALLIGSYLAFVLVTLNNLIAWVLTLFFVLTALGAHKPFNLWLFVVAALGGFFGEYICVFFGVWVYTKPGFGSLGMPVSLPLAWGVSANLIWLCARAFVRTDKVDKMPLALT
ncbi:MAG: hypothetical protein QMD09_03760 [Desulfatibacillaceae bacterium]|nr:hypothetical protein [Desulfatibacillaceae bacterium]